MVLQKSKVASVRIFGETLKHEAIDNLARVTEVACEFGVERLGPSDIYTKTAPAGLGIFDTFGKTTFATLSAKRRHDHFALIVTRLAATLWEHNEVSPRQSRSRDGRLSRSLTGVPGRTQHRTYYYYWEAQPVRGRCRRRSRKPWGEIRWSRQPDKRTSALFG
jgi:hypothetical protein